MKPLTVPEMSLRSLTVIDNAIRQ